MMLRLAASILERIQLHGERAYPEEGAGFLLGKEYPERGVRNVVDVIALQNAREADARGRRYLITPLDYLRAEMQAERQGLELVGVFHSHPDHPDVPSDFDRDWAQPQFTYLITGIAAGAAGSSRAWRLSEDRAGFTEEEIQVERST